MSLKATGSGNYESPCRYRTIITVGYVLIDTVHLYLIEVYFKLNKDSSRLSEILFKKALKFKNNQSWNLWRFKVENFIARQLQSCAVMLRSCTGRKNGAVEARRATLESVSELVDAAAAAEIRWRCWRCQRQPSHPYLRRVVAVQCRRTARWSVASSTKHAECRRRHRRCMSTRAVTMCSFSEM